MALKPHVNSLRCKHWYGFAKNKLQNLKNYDIPGKTYLINGYQIIIKALTDLVVIKAPPGLAIFRKGPGEITLYVADSFGYCKEKPVEVQTLRGVDGEPPLNPMDDGWPGAILPIALGGDEIMLYFGGRPDTSKDTPSYFTTRSSIGLKVLAVAPYAFRYTKGFLNTVSGVTLPHVFTYASTGTHYVFGIFGEKRNPDYGFPAIYFGHGALKRGGYFELEFALDIPDVWMNGSAWNRKYCQYLYAWSVYNNAKRRRTVRMMAIIQGVNTGFNYDDCFFLFMDFDPVTEEVYYMGYTDAEDLEDLDPNLPVTLGGKVLGQWFIGAPETQTSEKTFYKNIIFPIGPDEVGIAHYNPSNSVIFCVNDYNFPYLLTGLVFPYVWDEFTHPFCVQVDSESFLYLYWEEEMLYGGEYTDINLLSFGSPWIGWTPIASFGAGIHLTSFTPIVVEAGKKIIIGTVFIEGEDGGMRTALLDTTRQSDWFIGNKFSDTRVDRCSATVFGDHPYVELRKQYTGTQWGWDYSYCKNYEEPPEGYPT
jgi:hypothetical protein